LHNIKELAGRRAAEFVEDGMRVGLGTGSTVHFTLLRLGERVPGEGLRIVGVPTSEATASKARELGIALSSLDEIERLDLTIDGADEIDGTSTWSRAAAGRSCARRWSPRSARAR
jgi:ribose 5-phosphate isomerase A